VNNFGHICAYVFLGDIAVNDSAYRSRCYHSVVYPSVCLSHSWTLLKNKMPFGRDTQVTLYHMGSSPYRKGRFGGWNPSL